MKRYIYCNDPGCQFELEVKSFGIADIIETFEIEGVSELNEIIDSCIDSCELTKKSQGFFPDPLVIQRELCSHVKTCLENRFGGRIFGRLVDEYGVLLSSESLDVLSEIVEMRYDAEEGKIATGEVILALLRNFLVEGVWQYGFRLPDGTILTDVSQWSKHIEYRSCGSWKSSSGIMQPMIWFGLEHERPVECWTINKVSNRSMLFGVHDLDNYDERWRSFWFNDSYIDWNTLFDEKNSSYALWMFVECGMESPVDAFNAVRESCPIELDENDTAASIARKTDELFLCKKNAWETGQTVLPS